MSAGDGADPGFLAVSPQVTLVANPVVGCRYTFHQARGYVSRLLYRAVTRLMIFVRSITQQLIECPSYPSSSRYSVVAVAYWLALLLLLRMLVRSTVLDAFVRNALPAVDASATSRLFSCRASAMRFQSHTFL